MAGGGVSSQLNPIELTQFTEPELRAAVEAAENWGTYVTVHAYMPRAIRQAVTAGVRCIDHGQLIDDPTAKLLGACLISHWSSGGEFDSLLGHEQGISPLEDR